MDSDGDGLSDGLEINTHNTNPNDTDTDNDISQIYLRFNKGLTLRIQIVFQ